MDLDTTILQSNTAKDLIKYIRYLTPLAVEYLDISAKLNTKGNYSQMESVKEETEDINKQFNKAWERRSKGYR